MRSTQWMLFAAAVAVAANLWLPGEAAQPAAPEPSTPTAGSASRATSAAPAAAAADDAITFEQYREWRLNQIARRRDELAAQLAADLPARQKTRLEQVKAYYDWLAGLPDADRDHRFRERFDRIDTNHDGTIDAAERAAWRDKQRSRYARSGDRQSAADPQ